MFRAAHEFDAREQRYSTGQQHRETPQVHIPLSAGVGCGRVPPETEDSRIMFPVSVPFSELRACVSENCVIYSALQDSIRFFQRGASIGHVLRSIVRTWISMNFREF